MTLQCTVHNFFDLETLPFQADDYSKLKFGCDFTAKQFGTQLARAIFNQHGDVLLSQRCVVIPSPYNFVANAATIMTKHMVNHLNELLVNANGEHVEYSIIHRKVSYINDYGFLSKKQRSSLIAKDQFYVNKQFVQDKTLILVDDINITGTHERRMLEVLREHQLDDNQIMFAYFARYLGNRPDIEAQLNFSGIKTIEDYVALTKSGKHNLIVRPIKFLMSQPIDVFAKCVRQFDDHVIEQLYHGCLGEGYYKIPSYQSNFIELSQVRSTRC